MGCSSGVAFEYLTAVQARTDDTVRLEACVDGKCKTAYGLAGELAGPSSPTYFAESEIVPERPVRTASLRVLSERTGEVVLDARYSAAEGDRAKLTRFTPNGERCGPECHTMTLRLDPTGTRLVAVASPK
jgi:hypothetical protein